MAKSSRTEGEYWLNAACRVLTKAGRPLHYNDIKKIISDIGLVPKGMKTTLEAAMCKEVQSTHRRIMPLPDRPGVFTIVSPGLTRDSNTAMPSQPLRTVRSSTRYRDKYRLMKRYVRDLIFSNAAICDEVVRLEEKLQRTKEERRYLLRRVMQREQTVEAGKQTTLSQPARLRVAAMHQSKAGVTTSTSRSIITTPGGVASSTGRPMTAQTLIGVEKRVKSTNQKRSARPMENLAEGVTVIKGEDGRNIKLIKRSSNQAQKQIKLRMTPIPLDTQGRPVFPIQLNTLTVYCLGEIIAQPGYYTTDHIYPVGYCSTRLYLSINPSSTSSLYTCKISDGGTAARFEIAVDDMPGIGFTGATPSQCHQQLLEAICASRGPGTVPIEASKGEEFFGLSHPTILNLIQSSAGARSCANYRWVRFESATRGARDEHSTVYVDMSPSVNMKLLEPH